jgi:hypothetical protein
VVFFCSRNFDHTHLRNPKYSLANFVIQPPLRKTEKNIVWQLPEDIRDGRQVKKFFNKILTIIFGG